MNLYGLFCPPPPLPPLTHPSLPPLTPSAPPPSTSRLYPCQSIFAHELGHAVLNLGLDRRACSQLCGERGEGEGGGGAGGSYRARFEPGASPAGMQPALQ